MELKNISKIYEMGGEKLYALKNVSIKIFEGDFVAIVGTSGSGKSTLMNMMGVLDKPTTGEVFLDLKNTQSLSKEELARFRGEKVGFIFQQYNLISRLSAFNNVKLTLDFLDYEEDKAEKLVEHALEIVGIKEKKNHLPTQLSGGQQQRVSIARSLVAKPSIILADEPTGALDSKTGKAVIKILRGLWDEKKTIIMITHDLNLAKYASRIIEIKDGVIIQDKINTNITPIEN